MRNIAGDSHLDIGPQLVIDVIQLCVEKVLLYMIMFGTLTTTIALVTSIMIGIKEKQKRIFPNDWNCTFHVT